MEVPLTAFFGGESDSGEKLKKWYNIGKYIERKL